jgi:hypothetical protein
MKNEIKSLIVQGIETGMQRGYDYWESQTACTDKIKELVKQACTRKIKNLLTGNVVEVLPMINHSNSSYGIPVWVDSEGNDYGQAAASILPCVFGYELLND